MGIGPGIDIKDFRSVFVFRSKEVLNDFIESGWKFGGKADAAAKSGDKGAADLNLSNYKSRHRTSGNNRWNKIPQIY